MPTKKINTETTWVDPDDAPELTADWFAGADLYDGEKLVRKGGRPRSENPKRSVNIRLDADLLDHLRASGPGWQSRVNETLRKTSGL